jgi:hypothetical protein
VTIKPIETRAYGHRFRSRLEARWAVAFTEAAIEWQYEPEGFDLGDQGFYLPDFWLPQVQMWAEVKPDCPTDAELDKCTALVKQSGKECLLLVGPPSVNSYWAILPESLSDKDPDCDVIDFCIFDGLNLHLSENRFYVCCGVGGLFPMPLITGFDSHPAVTAALSARFEHGESPQ